MSPILFGTVFGLIMIYMIVNVFSMKTVLPVAKAGKVTDPYSKEEALRNRTPKTIRVDGKSVDVSDYEVLYVHGNSMKKYNIKDKNRIFVNILKNCDHIDGHPVLVFQIVNPKPNDAEYKLRKFVCLIDSIEDADWSAIYNANRDRISISENEFVEQCQRKAERDKDLLTGKVVLSETFDESAQKDCYSLHALTTAYATVEYAA